MSGDNTTWGSQLPFPWRPFVSFASMLALIYGSWLLAFWPGVLGEDSLAVLLEIEHPANQHSGKPALWYWFVRLCYEGTRRVEVPIAILMGLAVLVFSRILAWYWQQGLRKSCVALLLLVCATPHMVYFAGTLYPDGYYAIAVAGLLFELWLAVKTGRMSTAGLLVTAATLPFAAFARPNGIIFLAPVAIALLWVDRRSRVWIAVILLTSIGLNIVATQTRRDIPSHGVLFPLAIFETANFLQPRPMNLWTSKPRVLPDTVQLLQRRGIYDQVVRYYDPDYWDPLVFNPQGPRVMGLPKEDRKALVRQFLTYNIWHNIPRFAGSRLNVMLTSAFAQGGLPAHSYAVHVLAQLKAKSLFRLHDWGTAETWLFRAYECSYEWRWLLWTPFVGIALTLWALVAGWRRRERALLLVGVPMGIQLGAITLFSIAGEYRYLLPFFTMPLVLIPAFLGIGSNTDS
ncbi:MULTISPECIES: hypothetical protein [unclassified Acidovorax]|uniref:hypothetical protein n=1 Tax=unclassified Acidovorax TaxID=2684926 RepID=UPI000D38FC16|nr:MULTISPECIES: hypothetical protein [unclassified Acidovorax]